MRRAAARVLAASALALEAGAQHARLFCPNRQLLGGPPNLVGLDDELWEAVPLDSAAPASFANLPEGCECVNEVQGEASCTSFTCHETCNLHVGLCDEFCCSDPDCSSAEVERFRATGTCKFDGETGKASSCLDVSTLEKVNAKYNMYVEQDDDPLSALLCVSINNDPYEGEFFQPQTHLLDNVALLDTLETSTQPSFRSEGPPDTPAREFYTAGAPVGAAAAGPDGSLMHVWGGRLVLPSAGPDGLCSDLGTAAFGQDVVVNSCVRPIPDLQAACADENGPLSTSRFHGALRIAKTPLSSINEPSEASWAEVALGSVVHVDLELGRRSTSPFERPGTVNDDDDEEEEAANSTRRTLGLASRPREGRLLASGADNSTFWDGTGCRNAVIGARYVILYDLERHIVGAELHLTLGDLTPDVASGTSNLAVLQSFHISFAPEKTAVLSFFAQNVVKRPVSGNPGYLQGLPVQAGNRNTTGADETAKTAVSLDLNGLSIMAPGGPVGACAPAPTAGQSWLEAVMRSEPAQAPVFFGVDAASSCTVELSLADFENMGAWCADLTKLPLFELQHDVVGIYGNADPLKAIDWLAIQRDDSALLRTRPSPVPGTLTCENVADQLDLEVLWAWSGETRNPQAMILGVRAVVGQSHWVWRKGKHASARQSFTFTHTVTFVEHKLGDADRFNYKPEVPPIIPVIPSDVFYPFDIVSGGAAGLGAALVAPLVAARLAAAISFS